MRVVQSLVFLLAVLAVLCFGILMGIDNSDPVRLGFLDWRSPSLPVFIWVCSALIVGVVLGASLSRIGSLGQRRALDRANRALRERQGGHG